MPRHKGCGPRIVERMLALGWKMDNGKEDVPRFSMRHGFDKSVVYEWTKDASTPEKHMGRLAEALQTTVAYLMFGIGAPDATESATPTAALPQNGGAKPAGKVPPRARTHSGVTRRPSRSIMLGSPATHRARAAA